jgi:hypothetical protein
LFLLERSLTLNIYRNPQALSRNCKCLCRMREGTR